MMCSKVELILLEKVEVDHCCRGHAHAFFEAVEWRSRWTLSVESGRRKCLESTFKVDRSNLAELVLHTMVPCHTIKEMHATNDEKG